jgi:membrane protein involved in colicin uptake
MFFRRYFDEGNPGGNPPVDPPANPPTKTFSQEEVNSIVKDRLARDGGKALTDLLAELGIKDTEEGKKLIDTARTAEQEKLSAAEKAEQARQAAEQKAATATAEAEEATKKANEKLLRAEVKLAAAAAGFRPEAVDDVFLAIDRTNIKQKEDDTFDGLAEAIEDVKKRKPFWLVEGAGKGGENNNGTPPAKPANPNNPPQDPGQKPERKKIRL